MPRRIFEHRVAGLRIDPKSIRTTAVPGGREARGVAEYRRLMEITGNRDVRSAQDVVSNERTPLARDAADVWGFQNRGVDSLVQLIGCEGGL